MAPWLRPRLVISDTTVPEATTMKSTTINPEGLGLAFGLIATVFYIGCVTTLAATPLDNAIIFFN